MKTTHILLSYCEDNRNTEISFHNSLESAQRQMYKEFLEAHCDGDESLVTDEMQAFQVRGLCDEVVIENEDNGNEGIGDDSAWVNDGTNHSNFDWGILPIHINPETQELEIPISEFE